MTPPRIKVEPLMTPGGQPADNQYIIQTPHGTYFQSYDRTIAYCPLTGKTMLDETYWDYSKTTGKYRRMFLSENIAETRDKIAAGEYILADLNNPENP